METLQERNQVLAGQVGFLQAQRQTLEERVKLLQAPPETEDEAKEAEEASTQEAVVSVPLERRAWWQRAWRLVAGD